MAETVHEFEYRLQAWAVLFIGSALVMFGLIFVFMAAVNTTGISSDLMTLDPVQAGIFYWGLAALFFFSAGALAWMGICQKKAGRVIRISKDGLSLPRRPLSSKIITIPLDDLIRAEVVSNRGIAFISVRHRLGTLAIPEGQVASKADFKQIFELISSHCPDRP
ncbi:MAG: hypothetical protein HUN04_14765 [Desulfobacter sp.]|nr:MAG: hypothetical protein HUN04_14765 [Desulfobacter sp.]